MPKDAIKHRKRIFGRRAARARRFPLGILLFVAIVALLALIRPTQLLLDINPANVRLPTATPHPTLRPAPTDIHGGHVVFTCTRQEINQICMIAPDGTGYRQLTEGNSNSYYPAISPNGEDVAFAVNQYDVFNLYRLTLEVAEGPRQPRSRTKQLTDNIGNTFSPSFSADGRQIAFLNRIGDEPASIWVMGNNGEEPRQLYAADGAIVALAWSPDGGRIAFNKSVGATFAYEVFLLDVQDPGSPPVQVSRGLSDIGGSVAWSPDQQYLVLFAGPAAAREIYRLSVADGSLTQLTHGGNNASPAYSPDGQFIVFNSLRNAGQADLYIMRADGHSTRQLTDFPEPDWQPKWGP
jgi:Tol biopolymer transport system component